MNNEPFNRSGLSVEEIDGTLLESNINSYIDPEWAENMTGHPEYRIALDKLYDTASDSIKYTKGLVFNSTVLSTYIISVFDHLKFSPKMVEDVLDKVDMAVIELMAHNKEASVEILGQLYMTAILHVTIANFTVYHYSYSDIGEILNGHREDFEKFNKDK